MPHYIEPLISSVNVTEQPHEQSACMTNGVCMTSGVCMTDSFKEQTTSDHKSDETH